MARIHTSSFSAASEKNSDNSRLFHATKRDIVLRRLVTYSQERGIGPPRRSRGLVNGIFCLDRFAARRHAFPSFDAAYLFGRYILQHVCKVVGHASHLARGGLTPYAGRYCRAALPPLSEARELVPGAPQNDCICKAVLGTRKNGALWYSETPHGPPLKHGLLSGPALIKKDDGLVRNRTPIRGLFISSSTPISP